jgi:hypothetical protein
MVIGRISALDLVHYRRMTNHSPEVCNEMIMNTSTTRREFLADVGRGMLVASVGYSIATDLGLSPTLAGETTDRLTFGAIEPLVSLMQETPADQLAPKLVSQLRAGVPLQRLVEAAALANARTFGGEDYVGFHTMMALAPALHMSRELPPETAPLPIFKVLYRNTNRIQEKGGSREEVLRQVEPAASIDSACGEKIRELVHQRDVRAAEQALAAAAQHSPDDAFNSVLYAVHDHTEVHRVVLPYRAWDLLGLIGKDQATTLLRQSVRYCIKAESWSQSGSDTQPATLLPKLLEEHKLLSRGAGSRKADDAWVDQMSQTIFKSTPEQGAATVAAALAEGFEPDALGEAITLAANQLILRDYGRRPSEEVAGKPIGSVHGDSIGVHACDSANAWRNMARVANPRNSFASLILGAYQLALDRVQRGGDFLNWQPLPYQRYLAEVKSTSQADLLRELEEGIRGNLQARVTGLVQRYGELGHPERPVFDLLLKYAISEDGSLHAEKFYRTVSEEFASTRPTFRWRHLIALGRVTASEYGRPAPGLAEARSLLNG